MRSRFLVGLIVFVVAVPITFVGLAMGLLAVEFVIHPTVILVISVVTALVASWAADGLAGDGLHTDLNQTVARNLAWGVVPASLSILSAFVPAVGPFLLFFVVIWMTVTATALALRHRRAKTSPGKRLGQTGVWLLGTLAATTAIVYLASLFGLTGA